MNSIEKTPEQKHEELTKMNKDILLRIGGYILEGLSEDEACTLAGFSPMVFHKIKEKDPEIRLFLQKQWIQFKHAHLKEINSKKSEKTSMWLLEKLRPEEFGSQRRGPEVQVNVMSAIIRDIQNDPKNANIIELPRTITGGTEHKSSQDLINIDSVLN